MYLRPACLLLSLLVGATSLSGIELFLKNGDRLLGELILESDDHLTIKHPVLGEIEIAKSALAEWPPSLETIDEPVAEQAVEPPPDEEAHPANPNNALVKKLPGYVWNSPAQLINALKTMNAKLGFSFTDKTSRRDQTDFRFFYNSEWDDGRNDYRFDTDYRYLIADGEVSEDRYTGDFRYRRQQQRDFFIQASSAYKRDPIRKIENWVEQGFGGGWKRKISADLEYSIGAEGSLKFEDLTNNADAKDSYQYLATLFQDSVYQVGGNYKVVQEAESFYDPGNSENWGYRFKVKLDGKITSGFSMRLGYEYSFENLVPTNVPKTDTLLSSSLLYTF